MRIAVIGGTEFIGRRIVEQLVDRGDDVTVLHRGLTEPRDWVGCEHVHVDRRDIATVVDAITACRPEAVVDTFALTTDDVEQLVPRLPDVPRVVLSSQDVYRAYELILADDEGEPVPIDEAAPLRRGREPYRGRGWEPPDYDKIYVEDAYLAHGGVVLRLPQTYGEYDGQRREEPLLRRVRAGRDEIPVGAANLLWSRGYVGEIARAVLAVLDRPSLKGEVFNLAEPTCRSHLGWARTVLAAAESTTQLVRVPDEMLPGDLRMFGTRRQHVLISSEKAFEVLGWRHADVDRCVTASVRWHMAHPPEVQEDDFTADDNALRSRI